MANHDFGSPCSCLECCTSYRDEACRHCGFKNTLLNVGSAERTQDRKGTRGYDVTYSETPLKNLVCFKCRKVTPKVPYYTDIDKKACARSIQKERVAASAAPCDRCAERVGFGEKEYRPITLTVFKGRSLCEKCLPHEMEASIPDPSDKSNKFVFNARSLKWELSRIRKACAKCGISRWLNTENSWRKVCGKCFLAANS